MPDLSDPQFAAYVQASAAHHRLLEAALDNPDGGLDVGRENDLFVKKVRARNGWLHGIKEAA